MIRTIRDILNARVQTAQADAARARSQAQAEAARASSEAARASAELARSKAEAVKAKTAIDVSRGQRKILAGALGDYRSARRLRTDPSRKTSINRADKQLDKYTADEMRLRCQAARRNDPTARALIKRLGDLVVQDGFGVEVQSKNTAYNAAAEAYLQRHERDPELCDVRAMHSLTELYRTAVSAACTDGGFLAVPLAGGRLQMIEVERLSNPSGTLNTDTMINGVELDVGGGRPTKFHVMTWKNYGWDQGGEREIIDAADAMLLNNPVDRAVGQTVGEPALQAAIPKIEALNDYIDSTQIAARVATYFSAIAYTDNPAQLQAGLEDATSDQPDRDLVNGPREIEIQRAMIQFLPNNARVEQLKPEHPSVNHDAFIRMQLMIIGADLGLPLCLSHLDAASTNFHGFKSAVSIASLGYLCWQQWIMRLDLRIKRLALAQGIRSGELPMTDDWDKLELYAPPMPVVDLETEISAVKDAVSANLMTARMASQRLGFGRWDQIRTQRGEETALDRKLGIVPADLPGAARPGAAEPPASGSGQSASANA